MIYRLLDYPQCLLLIMSATANFLWVAYTHWLNTKIKLAKRFVFAFTLIATASAAWTLTNAYFQSELLIRFSEKTAILMAILSNITGNLSTVSVYYLSCLLIAESRQKSDKVDLSISKSSKIFIYFICLGTLVLNIFFPEFAIKSVEIKGINDFILINGSLSWLYYLLLIAPIFPSIVNILVASRSRSSLDVQVRSQNYFIGTYVLIGALFIYPTVLASIIIKLTYNIYTITWIPSFFIFITVSLYGYAIAGVWRKKTELEPLAGACIGALLLAVLGVIFYLALIGLRTFILS